MQNHQNLIARRHEKNIIQIKIVPAKIGSERVGWRKGHAVRGYNGKVNRLFAHQVEAIRVVENASSSVQSQAVNVQGCEVIRGINKLRCPPIREDRIASP